VELRQLRYFVTLAEELHFGRAAARQHIVQSALSQQIQRLERELGTTLVERSTHHVRLTVPGAILLVQARQILSHVERASAATRTATAAASIIRIAVGDASFDSMPQVLRAVQLSHPQLEIHQVEASVPEQYQLLADGRMDAGIGRASHAPRAVASEVVRLDPMGVLFAEEHRFAQLQTIQVAMLSGEPLLFAEEDRAPEFNQFIGELCRAAGFIPKAYRGTVQSVRGAAELVRAGHCLLCVPRSCGLVMKGIRWSPLVDPPSYYPWSLLWRAEDETEPVRSVIRCARALSGRLGWTEVPGLMAAEPAGS
jgi:DNA-binding transcriptional LysR family regulator